MEYISTRSNLEQEPSNFLEVLRGGLAPDGGLYVPAFIPELTATELAFVPDLSYSETANLILEKFVGESIPQVYLPHLCDRAYGHFNHQDVAVIKPLYGNDYLLELFHGPTLSFKDYALQFLGQAFNHYLEIVDEKITILAATSGDTGSAAIEAVRGLDNLNITVLHPHNRISDVQRCQMTTVLDDNVQNLAIEGTFDDGQRIVKDLFADEAFRQQVGLGAVNSINWARIAAQIVYYVKTAVKLGKEKPVSFCVPTANFGNIFAGFMAKKMGAPIGQLYLATNQNDILTRFIHTGEMRVDTVAQSLSPSMDIQVSSNFERFLYFALEKDTQALANLMNTFKQEGHFNVPDAVWQITKDTFKAIAISDDETLATIKSTYEKTGELIDPHTAVAVAAAGHLRQSADEIIVSLACAHPAKFPEAVQQATGQYPALPEHLNDLMGRKEKFTVVPASLDAVKASILENFA